MSFFRIALTTCSLALAALVQPVIAGDRVVGPVSYSIESHAPILERGDADLWSSWYNKTRYEFFVEHHIVDSRKVVCTTWCTAEERRGSTKYRFPARSYVLYTAPSGKYVKGFRFASYEQFRTYNVDVERFEDHGVNTMFDRWGIVLEAGPADHYLGMSGDLRGPDRGMYYDFWGHAEIQIADIDYSRLRYRGSMVAPSSRGRSFLR